MSDRPSGAESENEMNKNLKKCFVESGMVTSQYKLVNDRLYYVSAIGERADSLRCVKASEHYKLYAMHFDCALPYTVYLLADRDSGIVYRYETNFPELDSIKASMD